jgi:hypothetical protein
LEEGLFQTSLDRLDLPGLLAVLELHVFQHGLLLLEQIEQIAVGLSELVEGRL